MTLNQIIGNKERKSKIDTELWKKMNEKYDNIQQSTPENIETRVQTVFEEAKIEEIDEEKKEGILTYDKNNIKIDLKILKKTLINTKTQKEYDSLMQIYHTSEISNNSKYYINYYAKDFLRLNFWPEYRDKTCIIAYSNESKYLQEIINFEKRENLIWKIGTRIKGYKILTMEEFYKKQNITQKTMEIINNYYDTNYPNRGSKG